MNAEILGIIATLFVFASFTQSTTLRIRSVNSIGCILFVVYGLMIGAFSVWFLNGACLTLNIYKIIKETKSKGVESNQEHHILTS